MIDTNCHFCGQKVNINSRTNLAKLVTGWVEQRQGGGAHGVRLQSTPQAFAHIHCLDREADRVIKGVLRQGSLL